ncbi:hypothetical protein GWI33_019791 [Rhynchophorus ferrugineus]|uniref:Uncharacterized protein n=1 Tax=Rhynchophorus ferrugineus TaxID=354439 RepID=A0A834HXL0_RHYFE|nr:hypothetical protein GWI33_019791 [Rhynchophorus ferrugineus]
MDKTIKIIIERNIDNRVTTTQQLRSRSISVSSESGLGNIVAAPAKVNGGRSRRGSARSSVESRDSVLDTIMENTKIVETDSTIDFEFYRRGLRGLSATELADVMKDLTAQVRLVTSRYCLKYKTYRFISTARTRVANILMKMYIVTGKVLKAKSAVVMPNTIQVQSITNAEAMVEEMINRKLGQIQHETDKRIQKIESLLQESILQQSSPGQ